MKRKKKMKIKVEPKKRNPLVAPVMKRGVRKHRNKKKEAKNDFLD